MRVLVWCLSLAAGVLLLCSLLVAPSPAAEPEQATKTRATELLDLLDLLQTIYEPVCDDDDSSDDDDSDAADDDDSAGEPPCVSVRSEPVISNDARNTSPLGRATR